MKAKYLLIPLVGIVIGKTMISWALFRETNFPEPDANIGVGIIHIVGLGVMWVAIIAFPVMLIWWILTKERKVRNL
jgi:hypothetical protein